MSRNGETQPLLGEHHASASSMASCGGPPSSSSASSRSTSRSLRSNPRSVPRPHTRRSPFETGFPMVFASPIPSPRPHRLSFSYVDRDDRFLGVQVFGRLLVSVVGIGMLAIPYTFLLIPPWQALIALVGVGVGMALTATAMVRAHVQLAAEEESVLHIGAGKRFSSFRSMAQIAGGDGLGYLVSVVTIIGIFGTCVGCICVAKDLAPVVVRLFYQWAGSDPAMISALAGSYISMLVLWGLFLFIVLPLCMLKKVSLLRLATTLGFVLSLSLVGCVIYRSFVPISGAPSITITMDVNTSVTPSLPPAIASIPPASVASTTAAPVPLTPVVAPINVTPAPAIPVVEPAPISPAVNESTSSPTPVPIATPASPSVNDTTPSSAATPVPPVTPIPASSVTPSSTTTPAKMEMPSSSDTTPIPAVLPTVIGGSSFSRLSLAVAIYIYAFLTHLNVIPLFVQLRGCFTEPLAKSERKMTEHIWGVTVICVLLYAVFGLACSRLYGAFVRPDIVLNLASDPLFAIPLAGVFITTLATFPLLFQPLRGVVEELVCKPRLQDLKLTARIGVTGVILLAELFCAVWVSGLQIVLALMGSTSFFLLGVALPLVLFVRLFRWRREHGGFLGVITLSVVTTALAVFATRATWFLIVDVYRH